METLRHVDSNMSYRIIAKYCLEKVTKIESVCAKIRKTIYISVQSRSGQNPPDEVFISF